MEDATQVPPLQVLPGVQPTVHDCDGADAGAQVPPPVYVVYVQVLDPVPQDGLTIEHVPQVIPLLQAGIGSEQDAFVPPLEPAQVQVYDDAPVTLFVEVP